MKYFLKAFMIYFVMFTLIIGSGMFFYIQWMNNQSKLVVITNPEIPRNIVVEEVIPDTPKATLDEAIAYSKRVNVLLIGTASGLADTIMLLSFEPESKLVDIVSIPRDTFNEVEGYNDLWQKKINATLTFKDSNGGPGGLTVQVSRILHVPVHYYVKVDYQAVRDVVDTIGGVSVDVPFRMNYDDPAARPPLHIHLEKGQQVLDGKKAIEYLRWRKNNGTRGNGDLPRVERQQEFMKLAIKKSVGLKLPTVIKTAMSYVETNMPLDQALYFATEAVGVDTSDIFNTQIPGVAKTIGLSYFYCDEEEIKTLMLGVYNRRFELESYSNNLSQAQ